MHSNIITSNQISHSPRSFIDGVRREQIIQCAIETIAEQGFGRASFVRIAKKAKISVGVISYHFSGRDELIEQVVAAIYAAGTQFMQSQIQNQTTATGALRTYIESNVEFIASHLLEMVALAQILPNFRDNQGKLRYDLNTEEPILASLADLLRWGQETGEFRPFDRRIMAITIRRAIDAIPPQFMADPNLDPLVYGRELSALFIVAVQKSI